MALLSTAVVGLRGIGKQHVKAIADHQRTSLVAVADINPELRSNAESEYKAKPYADYREMLDAEKLDAVIFATPHHLHAPMALDALSRDHHVFVEKPIAMRVSEADKMVHIAKEKERVLAVGHNYRTFPGNVRLKELLPKLGPVYRVFWQWLENRPESYYDRDIWRSTWRLSGGGVLMNQTSHDLDLLCWLLGKPVEVSAMIYNRAHRHEVEDTAIANIRFETGAFANVQLSTVSHRLNYRQFAGENGTILFQDEKNANVHIPQVFRLGLYDHPVTEIIQGGDSVTGQPEPDWQDIDCSEASSPSLLDSFIDACLDGGEPITNGESAHTTLELINAIVLSGVRKKNVELPIDRDEYDDLFAGLVSGKVKIEGVT